MSTRIEPTLSEIAAPFWEATRSKEFVLQFCNSCGTAIHYPRALCPSCHDDDLAFRPASGRGRVYAHTVLHRPGNPTMADRVPYVVALIELEEGARMLSNVVGCEPQEVAIGMEVQVTWEDLSDGRALPLFEPAAGERGRT